MEHGTELVVFGLILLVAYLLGRLAQRAGLPAIPVYMLVGLLASPHTGWFPLNFDQHYIEFTAIFGLLMLLFSLGIEFDQDQFYRNAGRLLISGGTYIAINLVAGLIFGFLVGWGTREALIIAGITATSSSAIVTKLLIELKRLGNPETPTILGVTVVEDVFIAFYLAVVGVVLAPETSVWMVVLRLVIAFSFVIAMFALARYGGPLLSKFIRTDSDELLTILFFGLLVLFGGIGDLLGVTDAIGAFLIGLVIGATRYRERIEHLSIPLRDIFAAFFFVNFGLAMNISEFGSVIVPVLLAVLMTIGLNLLAGLLVAKITKLGPGSAVNMAFILHNRGEFALILAALAMTAGLNNKLVPFAGLYVVIMSIIGPILAVNSERFARRKTLKVESE